MSISPRRSVVELAHYTASNGADELGEIHMAVTEGRAKWYKNSPSTSCGDLVQACLYAAGCRESWVNREEHEGWRSGQNLSLFVPLFRGRSAIDRPRIDQLQPGDLGIYDYDYPTRTHGWVYLGLDDRGRAITADFGQPGGRIYHCEVGELSWSRILTLRGRPVDRVIPLDSVTFTEPAETVVEWCARYGLQVLPWQPLEHM